MAARLPLPTLTVMEMTITTHCVEVTFVGALPRRRIERAAGVGDVEVDPPVVRCLVVGSFQPFLEALHGHEVVTLRSTPAVEPAPPQPTPATRAQATRAEGEL
jgi:hypothetical protein